MLKALRDQEITEPSWGSLTVIPSKRKLFSDDGPFREGWRDTTEIWGEQTCEYLHRFALLLFKPDAFFGGRANIALRLLEANNFIPVAIAPVCYDARLIHAVWHYHIHVATIERILVQTRYACPADTYVLALEDTTRDRIIPASVRLKRFKGSASLAARHAGSLRSALESPNGLLNFVHSPEEPADIVRELALYLGYKNRIKLLREIVAAVPLEDPLPRTALTIPDFSENPDTLAFESALKSFSSSLEEMAGADGRLAARRTEVLKYLTSAISGKAQFELSHLERLLSPFPVPLPNFHLYVLCTYLVPFNRAGQSPPFEDAELERWNEPRRPS